MLLQANPMETVSELVENGNLDKFFHEIIALSVNAGKSILLAIVIFVVGRFLINIINRLISKALDKRKVEPTIQTFLKSFTNILLTILLIISVVSALGVNTTSFAALLASAGVAVGMALSGNLQNLAGGLILLLFKPYKVGDYIDAQCVSGTVKAIQIFHTILTTPDNKEIYIPNGSLSSGCITNYNKNDLRRVDMSIGVEYGTDVEKVRKTIQSIFDTDERILKDPAPFVELAQLADSSINFTIRMWVENSNYWGVHFDMTRKIYEEFNRQNIGFPFPQIQIHQS